MENHVKIIAILWLISGAFWFFGALFILVLMFGISFFPDVQAEGAGGMMRWFSTVMFIPIGVAIIPQISGGIGLLKKKPWGRALILFSSVLALVFFPFGTALGIYSIYILTHQETTQLFETPG
jgi:hypothetical protein